MKLHGCFLTLLSLLIAPIGVVAQTAIPDERLIQWLDGSDLAAKEAVVNWLVKNGRTPRQTAVDDAVARELTRLNAERKLPGQVRAEVYGQKDSDGFAERWGNYHAAVIQAATLSDRQVMITPLAGALGTGNMAIKALARFGDRAVPELSRVARANDEPDVLVTSDAIRALELMTRQQGSRLSPSTRSEILRIATARLSGKQSSYVIAAACRLAAATGDTGLRARLIQIAESPEELTKMSVTDARSRKRVEDVLRTVLGRPKRGPGTLGSQVVGYFRSTYSSTSFWNAAASSS